MPVKLSRNLQPCCNEIISIVRTWNIAFTFKILDASSVCSSAPSLSELDSELAQLEQDQATKFITEETVSTVLDIASKKSHEDGESRTLESDDETDCVKQSNEVNDKDTLLMPPPTFPIGRPTAASLGLRESIEEHMKIRKPDEPEEEVDESGELDLTGIDDEELDLVSNFLWFS